jgi:hypothetical protein
MQAPKFRNGRKAMIELTAQQTQLLNASQPTQVVNPLTREKFVLVPLEEYQRLTQDDYDDSPWTSEEREALAWEAGKHAGWETMTEYDDYPDSSEKP